MAMSEAHKRAVNKYNATAYEQINIRVYKGQREQITAYAAEQGKSLNGYINDLIAKDMGERLTRPDQEQGK